MDLADAAAEPAIERLRRGPPDRERGGQVVGLQEDHGNIPTGSVLDPDRFPDDARPAPGVLAWLEASAIRSASAWPGSSGTAKATHCMRPIVPAARGAKTSLDRVMDHRGERNPVRYAQLIASRHQC